MSDNENFDPTVSTDTEVEVQVVTEQVVQPEEVVNVLEPETVTTSPTSVDDLTGLEEILSLNETGLDEEEVGSDFKSMGDVHIPPFHEQTIAQEREAREGKKIDGTYAFQTIPRQPDSIRKFISSFPNEDISQTELGAIYQRGISNAEETYLNSTALQEAANKPGVKLHQKVPYSENGEVKGHVAGSVLKPLDKGGKRLEGEAAVLRMAHALGEKRILRFPLYATGITVALKPPADEDIYTLLSDLNNDTELMGRMTGGGVFSNQGVIVMERMLRFAIDHIYETNYHQNHRAGLSKIIKLPDAFQLLIYTMAAIHQSGFPFKATCIENPNTCNHTRTTLLNIASLSRTFTDKLSQEQLRFLYTRPSNVTDEQLKSYQEAFVFSENLKTIVLNENVSIRLKIPSLEEYFEVGNLWVTSLIERANDSLAIKVEGRKREQFLTNLAKLNTLRQYGHFIEAVIIDGDEVTDRTSIDMQLNRLSSNQKYVKLIFDTIDKFNAEATITICALVEDRACPKCGGYKTKYHDMQKQPYTNLIVLDPSMLFFLLAGLHLARIFQQD